MVCTKSTCTVSGVYLLLIYPIGVEAFHNSQHGAGSGAIFFDLLSCDGSEKSIYQCSMRYLHSCSHSNDASIQCIGESLDTNISSGKYLSSVLMQMSMNVWWRMATAAISVLMTYLGITVNVTVVMYCIQMD